MTDEPKVQEKIEYGIADFITEIDTVIWEKSETAKREAGRHNIPMAGLTNLRVDRLNALSFYLRKIENFQKGKPAPKEAADPSALAIERAAIATLFSDDTALHLALGLNRGDFRDPTHGKIFDVAKELVRMAKTVNIERLRTFIPAEGHAALDAFEIKQPEEEQPPAAEPEKGSHVSGDPVDDLPDEPGDKAAEPPAPSEEIAAPADRDDGWGD